MGCIFGAYQVSHESLVVGIAAHELERPVVFFPSLTHLLPFLPCHLNGIGIYLAGLQPKCLCHHD